MWKVLIFSFVLSHTQSENERGFNISDTLLVETQRDLKAQSLTAQRSVKDFINASNVSVGRMEIDSMMIKSCKAASNIYR